MNLLDINSYLWALGRSIPECLIGISFIIVLCLVLFIAIKGIRKGVEIIVRLLLADFVAIILYSTVFSRKSRSYTRLNFTPFRTYFEAFSGNSSYILPQAILNILIFIPLGLLLNASFPSMKWWYLLIIGCGLSVVIEFLQLIMHKGFCEFDDVMHNTIGCLIGLLCYNICRNCFAKNRVVD